MMLFCEVQDQDDLESFYRNLYWKLNELQIVGNPACLEIADKVCRIMRRIENRLGFIPAI